MRFFLIFFLFIYGVSSGQTSKSDCSIMKNGTFKYLEAPDPTAYFVITDSSHTEYFADDKYYIKSQMDWITDCKYKLTMLSITLPDFPFKPGDIMIVTINKIKKGIIYYTADVNNQDKWDTKVK